MADCDPMDCSTSGSPVLGTSRRAALNCFLSPCTRARREFARAGAAPPLQGGDRKRAWEQAPPHPWPGAPPRPTLGHRLPHPPHVGVCPGGGGRGGRGSAPAPGPCPLPSARRM
ncbi:unnamed protein product, partial [Rangifer tarandus platyrhynchus]